VGDRIQRSERVGTDAVRNESIRLQEWCQVPFTCHSQKTGLLRVRTWFGSACRFSMLLSCLLSNLVRSSVCKAADDQGSVPWNDPPLPDRLWGLMIVSPGGAVHRKGRCQYEIRSNVPLVCSNAMYCSAGSSVSSAFSASKQISCIDM
jgi:hypothetical protein